MVVHHYLIGNSQGNLLGKTQAEMRTPSTPPRSGFSLFAATPTGYSHLKNATSIGSATAGSATGQTVPAYSIVVVQLHR